MLPLPLSCAAVVVAALAAVTAHAAEVRLLDVHAAPGAMAPRLVAVDAALYLTWIEPEGPGGTGHALRFARLDAAFGPARTIARGAALFVNWADVPSLAGLAGGALYAHWAERTGEAPYAYAVELARSDDGGATWRRLGRPHRDDTATEHGFVSLLPDGGGVLAVWLDGRATASGGPTALRAATLRGGLDAEVVLDERVCDCCSTSATMTPEGPLIAFRDRSDDELRDIAVVRRVKGRWTPPVAVHRDDWKITGCPVNGPALAAAGGDVALAWFTAAGERPRVLLVRSSDGGASFGAPIEVDAASPVGRVDVAMDASGDAFVSWIATATAGDAVQDAVLRVRRVGRDGQMGVAVDVARTTAARASGVPRMVRRGSDVVIAWTEASQPSRLRVGVLAIDALPRAAAVAAVGLPSAAQAQPQLPPPQPLDYSARTLGGAPVALESLRGRAVVVNVWATWCEPCRRELPLLGAVQRRFASRGLRVVALSVNARAEEAQALARELALPVDWWHDAQDRAAAAFGAATLPVTLVLDRSGVVRWRHAGALHDDAALVAAVEQALGGAR
jgi:thiol-disulfide isomerase/thioredoxin